MIDTMIGALVETVAQSDRQPHPARSAPSTAVQFLRCVIDHESGGDPKAENPHSSASGLFQFLDSTWRGNARWVDSARGFARASHAPARVQWEVALHSVSKGGHSNWVGTGCGYGT
jgi:hypothetical protein